MRKISSIEDRVARALKRETAFILDATEESVDLKAFTRDIWPGVQLDDELAEEIRHIFTEELSEYLPELSSHYTHQIDPALTVEAITKRTVEWVDKWSEELGSMMHLNSHAEIGAILGICLKEGQSVAAFTQAIRDSGIRDEHYKARRVAVTETLRAHSYAQEEALIQNPAVESKEWIHTGAYRNEPRQNHVDLSGVVVPKNEPFELFGADGGIYYPMFPRDSILPPSEAVNCHCIHRGIVSVELLGLPLEERRRLQAEAIAEDNGAWEKELDANNKVKAEIEPPHNY